MGKKYNGFDALKFGFFGQIGRSAGRDVYKSVINSAITVNTSGIDQSKLGEVDANGHFTYDKFKRTSVVEYIFWLIFIGIMPHLSAVILFIKTLIRLFRRKVRFVVYYNCPAYQNGGKKYVGDKLTPFVFKKTYEEADMGEASDGKMYSPVASTKLNTLLYLLLTIVAAWWGYYSVIKIKELSQEQDLQKHQYAECLQQWNDSTAVDDFTSESTTIRYIFPATKDDTDWKDFALVERNGSLYLYISTLSFSKVDLKFYNGGNTELTAIDDFNPDILDEDSVFTVKPKGLSDIQLDYRYTIDKDIVEKIGQCDSFAIRSNGVIYSFRCKQ